MATATNQTTIQFPSPTGSAWAQPTHYGLWNNMSGGTVAANLLGSDLLTSTVSAPPVGADVEFANGALTISIPNGDDFTDRGSRTALVAFLASGTSTSATGVTSITDTTTGSVDGTNLRDGVYISLHVTDPKNGLVNSELGSGGSAGTSANNYSRVFVPFNRLGTNGAAANDGTVGGWTIT